MGGGASPGVTGLVPGEGCSLSRAGSSWMVEQGQAGEFCLQDRIWECQEDRAGLAGSLLESLSCSEFWDVVKGGAVSLLSPGTGRP